MHKAKKQKVNNYSGGYRWAAHTAPTALPQVYGRSAPTLLILSFVHLQIKWNGENILKSIFKASLKALIVNRIGDFGFLCGVVLIFYNFRIKKI